MPNVATRFQPDISGSAVPSGYIGESQRIAMVASSATSSGATYVNSSATWTLTTAGIYRIDLDIAITTTTTVASSTPAGTLALRTTTPNTIEQKAIGMFSNSAAGVLNNFTLSTVVNISSSTTYQVSVQSNTASNYTFKIEADGTALGGTTGTISSFARWTRIA